MVFLFTEEEPKLICQRVSTHPLFNMEKYHLKTPPFYMRIFANVAIMEKCQQNQSACSISIRSLGASLSKAKSVDYELIIASPGLWVKLVIFIMMSISKNSFKLPIISGSLISITIIMPIIRKM